MKLSLSPRYLLRTPYVVVTGTPSWEKNMLLNNIACESSKWGRRGVYLSGYDGTSRNDFYEAAGCLSYCGGDVTPYGTDFVVVDDSVSPVLLWDSNNLKREDVSYVVGVRDIHSVPRRYYDNIDTFIVPTALTDNIQLTKLWTIRNYTQFERLSDLTELRADSPDTVWEFTQTGARVSPRKLAA